MQWSVAAADATRTTDGKEEEEEEEVCMNGLNRSRGEREREMGFLEGSRCLSILKHRSPISLL